jgi:4-hydroxy-tetrahydrodipicolinate reductase
MPVKVLINGANGKMGLAVAKVIEDSPALGFAVVARRDNSYEEAGAGVDLVIDFSLPPGARAAYALAKKNKAAFLTGTTNMSEEFITELKEEREIPVFYSPNVSIGVYLFTRLLQDACKLFAGYERKMHEIHHTQKKDAPSGTAKSLAAAVNFPEGAVTYERTGAVPGTHSLTLISSTADEEITLTHRALDRVLFANSAVKIAAWLSKQKPGFYDMAAYAESLK